MPQKQVIINLEHYKRLCTLGALSIILNDQYIKDHRDDSPNHIVDREECDPVQRDLYYLLANLGEGDAELLKDVLKELPDDYEIPEGGALELEDFFT